MRRPWSYGVLLALGGCVSAGQSDPSMGVYVFKDVLRPHGHARSRLLGEAAVRACDHGDPAEMVLPAFKRCMRAKGWVLAAYAPPSAQDDSNDIASPTYDTPSPPPPPPMLPPGNVDSSGLPIYNYDPITGAQMP
jgi:hypothetical protein